MNFLQKIWQQLTAWWAGLGRTGKLMYGGSALLIAAVVAAALYYSYQVDYRELAGGLTQEDAGAITARLKADNVPYKLANGGTSVLVPSDQVQQLRLTMANEGIAGQSTEGYKLLDSQSFTTSPSMQNVNLIRAQQGELARTIMKMDAVAGARVHIARPDPSPFIREQKPTTASVILKLKPNTRLSRATAQAITAMVSHAIEGLPPEQVTIMDTTGKLLSEQHAGEAEGGGNGGQLDYRREIEGYLSSRAQELLVPILGPNHQAIVRVAVETKPTRMKQHIESFSPTEKVAREETTRNSSNSAGGGARAASNSGKGIQAAGPGGGGKQTEEDTEVKYDVPKTTQDIEELAGIIDHLTVSAVIDIPNGADGKPVVSVDDVRDVIKQAIGFRADRKDEIKVALAKLTPIDTLDIPNTDDANKLASYQSYVLMARDGAFGLSAVIGVVFVVSLLRRLRTSPRALQPATGTAAGAGAGADSPGAPFSPSSRLAGEGQVPPTSRNGEESLMGEVSVMARENPAMLAKVLSSMMSATEVVPQTATR
jgi:flagellar M-ring protein FliF